MVAAVVLSACATNRSVINVAAPEGEQPKSTSFAKIVEVRDLRQFSVNPSDPSLPSLGSEEEIKDTKITARSVARKRNSFGMAMGDVTLAEGNSVAALVRNSAKKALQDKGYVVVEENAPGYAGALPLAIDIEQFWAWMQPGFASLTFTFNSTVNMKGGNLLVTEPSVVRSQSVVNSGFGTESTWIQAIQGGINTMTEQIKAQIKAPAGAPAISQTDGPAEPLPDLGS